jgi:mannose-6-phosphate isomerase-like protein (cupin superfamily)
MSSTRVLGLVSWFGLICCGGCMTPASRAAGTIVSPADSFQGEWTDQEKASNTVMRNLRTSQEVSFHVLRVRTELGLRKHAKSDLVLVVVAGQVELHLGDRTLPSAPGDVVEVPRDVPYAAINKGKDAAVLYAVFSPGFDPDDVKTVAEASGTGSWQYNLWTQ